MKKVLWASMIALSANSLFASNTVNVKITNIRSSQGEIHVGFYKRGENFPAHESKHYKKIVKPSFGTMDVAVEDLPNGEYAIAMIHDLNGNDRLDTNLFGIPKEPYGFSKNFKPLFSAPDFDDCAFELYNETKSFVIELID
jgi:uncharacterized protein (DUF2141 family)